MVIEVIAITATATTTAHQKRGREARSVTLCGTATIVSTQQGTLKASSLTAQSAIIRSVTIALRRSKNI